MYEKGTGRYQKAYDRLSALAPWYGYTGKRWMDAFICLRRLYQGFCKGYLGECFQSEVERYLHPLFPAFNLGIFNGGDRSAVEQQMDVVLNILDAVAEREFQVDLPAVWRNKDLRQVSVTPMAAPGWERLTFGTQAVLQTWCSDRVYEGWRIISQPPEAAAPRFQLGGLQGEFRETDKGLTLFLSDGETEVASLRLVAIEKRLGDAKWTEVIAVMPRSIKEDGYYDTNALLTPDNLPTVYMREDGKLYCRVCHCTVPNTANHEMRKEGYYSHSHVCGFRSEGEVYDD